MPSKAKLWADLREDVHGRENGQCVRCRWSTPLDRGECHHRQLRSRGGKDDAWNCIWLCQDCHAHIHSHPAEATDLGYMVPRWADPREWPVLIHCDTWMQPTPHGWMESARRDEVPPPDGVFPGLIAEIRRLVALDEKERSTGARWIHGDAPGGDHG